MSTQLETFLAELRSRGVQMQCLWETRRDGRTPRFPKYPADVTCYAFRGDGFAPSVAVAVVIDYGGNDGFGFFTDSTPNSLADLAAAVATPREEASR